MWTFGLFLLNLLGQKNFLRFIAGSSLITLFLLYCLFHDGFDQPQPAQRAMNPGIQRPAAVKRVQPSVPQH